LSIVARFLAAAIVVAGEEPGIVETQDAAARAAGGTAEQDRTRTARARSAHWAPQLRAQGGARDDERLRSGEYRAAPIREQDAAAGRTWSLMVTWDLSQIVYAREESQLALAHAHLARMRREAAERAAALWIERQQARALWASLRTRDTCFALLRLTAQLDALTDGLFRESASREESACASEGGSK
jgi:hypothetical protein